MCTYKCLYKVYEHTHTHSENLIIGLECKEEKKHCIKGKRFTRGTPILDRLLGKVSDRRESLKEVEEQAMLPSRRRVFKAEEQ